MNALSVAVICGGPSAEAEVSRTSARAVAAALESKGHEATLLELDGSLPAALGLRPYQVVFPAVHGALGEDGCLQGLLEVLGFPYVGSDVLSSALAMNKPQAKVVFRAAGLPVPEEVVVRARDVSSREDIGPTIERLRKTLGPSFVIKPATGGSAIGVTRLREDEGDAAIAAAIEQALGVSSVLLVERFRSGKEVTCAVLEDEDGTARALSPTLILPKAADWYDFQSRYAKGGSTHECPPPFSPELILRIQDIARRAHEALLARDLSRADFVVDDATEEVTLLEVNTLPGMTATSLFPEACAVAKLPFADLCDRLVRRAHARARRTAPAVVPMPQ